MGRVQITTRRSCPQSLTTTGEPRPAPTAGWLEVRSGGRVLGWVTTAHERPGATQDGQQFTAVALVRGEPVWCTAHRFGWQEDAARWVAREYRPEPTFTDDETVAFSDGTQVRVLRARWVPAPGRAAEPGRWTYVCRRADGSGDELHVPGWLLTTEDGRTETTEGVPARVLGTDDMREVARRLRQG